MFELSKLEMHLYPSSSLPHLANISSLKPKPIQRLYEEKKFTQLTSKPNPLISVISNFPEVPSGISTRSVQTQNDINVKVNAASGILLPAFRLVVSWVGGQATHLFSSQSRKSYL
ncbi:hypothetical protein TWF173_011542 [Orbilia oligospora]|nr:hypothetical protein TWF173_011542 [Orbilia oligospora]